MFIGGAQFSAQFGAYSAAPSTSDVHSSPASITPQPIEYFRSERIIEDFVLFVRAILDVTDGAAERTQALALVR